MYLKVYRIDNRDKLLAACDKELINTVLKEGEIELLVSDKFYGTEETDEAALINALRRTETANLVGKKVVGAAVRAGIINEDDCMYIGGVPHVQIL